MKRKIKGFSLMELMIVIVLIGILAASGFIYYGDSAEEDKDAHDAYQEKLRKELADKNLI